MNKDYPFEYNDDSVKFPKYNGYITRSCFITMRDGIKIAADVSLPKNLAFQEKIPTVLIQTRYWRAYRFRAPFKWLIKEAEDPKIVKILTSRGFAVCGIDVRGTGASYGNRSYPFSDIEIQDGADIIDWIISQSWSDGNVVTCGNSYKGATAELTATLNHPAIKCVLCKHNPWDFYLHAAFPGGVFNEKFIQLWSNLGKALDQTTGAALKEMKSYNTLMAKLGPIIVKGVNPVEKDDKQSTLKIVANIHTRNNYPIDYFERIKTRDDPMDDEGHTIDSISIFTQKDKIEKLNIPFYTWSSWWDSTTANATIYRFLYFKNPQKAVIGDWDHKALHRANPFFSHKNTAKPIKDDQIIDWVKFYKDCLNDNFGDKKVLYYYTMGEEKWKRTTIWPPKNQEMTSWYLNKNNLLTKEKPKDEHGVDKYAVNYDVTTGIRNRWYTLLSVPIFYPDREEQDKKLLTYTSEPLEEDIEITGHPEITLFLKTTHKDGFVCVYLEFIDENNKIHWITDGQLHFIHRKISSESPPYQIFEPYHSFKRKDVLPVVPNELMEIKFALYPTSILLRRGYRIKLALSGADKDTFAREPQNGMPILTIERNTIKSSLIKIPIIKK
ncbi:MAG: CocE/NonD family hydrolase [Candidatus Lokiarchaeota archaeon]|nr:CocE/NonD family hydrolase [Candidatus Lokiarchaeota archaeon]